jgi:hypothetical protein
MEANLPTVLLLCCCVLELLILLLFLRPLMVLRATPERVGNQCWLARSHQSLDPGKTVAVLQELQRLLKNDAQTGSPSLIDVASLISRVQAEFGEMADLEQVIQQLVLQDALALMGEQKRAMQTLRNMEARRGRKQSSGGRQQTLFGEVLV